MYEEYLIYLIICTGLIYGYLKCGKMNRSSLTVSAVFVGLVGSVVSAAIMSSVDLVTLINNFVAVAIFVVFLTLLFIVGVSVPLAAMYLADITFKLKSKSNITERNEDQ
ncbi:MAG: hypothetical protein OIN86_12950 [Candidatus Methanoperedens sp.]|nr:hypothetical protein [Candidatus Methanoperedens sp.]CAG0948631.1 hypothetical protein METP1_00043 [Methanosarcinales archaeon]